MSPSAFVKPKNIFPDGWFIRQSQDKYLTFAAPYYAVARKAGLRKQFLEVFYSVWFDRWPVTVESDDEYEVNWAISVQQDLLDKKLFWAGVCTKTVAPTDRWEDVINLKADRAHRRASYYKCRALGIHLDAYEYINTVEKEEDRVKISAEESMRVWAEAMTIDANIFDTDY